MGLVAAMGEMDPASASGGAVAVADGVGEGLAPVDREEVGVPERVAVGVGLCVGDALGVTR